MAAIIGNYRHLYRRINAQSLVAIDIVTSIKVWVNPNTLEIVALVSPCEWHVRVWGIKIQLAFKFISNVFYFTAASSSQKGNHHDRRGVVNYEDDDLFG